MKVKNLSVYKPSLGFQWDGHSSSYLCTITSCRHYAPEGRSSRVNGCNNSDLVYNDDCPLHVCCETFELLKDTQYKKPLTELQPHVPSIGSSDKTRFFDVIAL